ncbi:MAG: acetate/propionate family kinase [Christensenellales bacterium]|nr:acetate kinase [Clostridiales bacterium]
MKILVINAGSSSLKYQLIDMENEQVIAKGLVERIGIEGSNLVHKKDGREFKIEAPMSNHVDAMGYVIKALTDPEHGAIKSMDEIGAVGHRVLLGGEEYTQSTIINDEVKAVIRKYIPLGPLHNPANLQGIEACEKVMPSTPQVAVFDTGFHQTMPKKAYLYALPMKYYRDLKVRRYGFHGTSHRFVSARCCELLGRTEGTKIIVCHLGNGSSLSAVVDGKCVDTSMGLTPLQGVVMGTRSGDVDPACLQYIMNNTKNDDGTPITIDQMLNILNKKSGLLGLSEKSSDMRDVMKAAAEGDEQCALTIDIWAYSIRKYIGAYVAAMGGLDALVFTAGVGENNDVLREKICEGLDWMGIKIDHEKDKGKRTECEVSAADSRVKIFVIPTNEELAIARDTLALVTPGK